MAALSDSAVRSAIPTTVANLAGSPGTLNDESPRSLMLAATGVGDVGVGVPGARGLSDAGYDVTGKTSATFRSSAIGVLYRQRPSFAGTPARLSSRWLRRLPPVIAAL